MYFAHGNYMKIENLDSVLFITREIVSWAATRLQRPPLPDTSLLFHTWQLQLPGIQKNNLNRFWLKARNLKFETNS